MTPAEYIVATLFCPIGIVVGLFWAIQQLPKAKTMIMVSVLCCIIGGTGTYIAWRAVAAPDDGLTDELDELPSFAEVHGYDPRSTPIQPADNATHLEDELDFEGQPLPIKRALIANVKIESGNSLGSGVVIKRYDDKAVILTNRHVLDPVDATYGFTAAADPENWPEPKIYYCTKQVNVGEILWVAPDGIDLAIVEASCPSEVNPVPWYPFAEPQTGEDVFAIGNPQGLSWTYTRGVISALRRQVFGDVQLPVIQTDTSITHGSSGGGLYDQEGNLIGINTFIVNPARAGGLGFSIRLNILEELAPEMLKFGDKTEAEPTAVENEKTDADEDQADPSTDN